MGLTQKQFTIYSGALLELAKLKRENEALLKIIEQLTAQEKLGKKCSIATVVNKLAPPDSKTELAKQLEVSRSSLYYTPTPPVKDFILKTQIEKVMSYGHRRIAIELGINKKRIKRVMKLFDLKVKRKVDVMPIITVPSAIKEASKKKFLRKNLCSSCKEWLPRKNK